MTFTLSFSALRGPGPPTGGLPEGKMEMGWRKRGDEEVIRGRK